MCPERSVTYVSGPDPLEAGAGGRNEGRESGGVSKSQEDP